MNMGKKNKKPTILVTNDDGVLAPGLLALIEVARELGDIIVVAPDGPQSGVGHAITVSEPLRLDRVDYFDGIEAWQCSGTPADCVKLAKEIVLHHKPDLCLSGINHGSNASINVIYSGTMSAAVEAAVEGINSIGFSLVDWSYNADFEPCKPFVKKIAEQVLKNGIPAKTTLNVNIPKGKDIKGVKVCRQAHAKWEEEFDTREDPNGRKYHWLTGNFVNHDKGEDTDQWALGKGYISVVPVQFDLTAHHAIEYVNELFG